MTICKKLSLAQLVAARPHHDQVQRTTARVAVLASAVLLAGGSTSGLDAQTVVLRATAGNAFKDGYNAGFGASAGVEFPFFRDRTWFFGGRFLYHSGADDASLPESMGGPEATGSVSQLHYAVEFGATWVSSPIILRTSGQIGVARLTGEDPGGLEESTNEFLLGPGAILAIPFSEDRGFVGLELKWHRVQNYDSALALYGTVGFML